MKRIVLALALFLLPSLAWGQCTGVFPNNSVCGNATGASTTPRATPATSFSNTVNTQTTNYSIQASDCNNTVQMGTGSTGFLTLTLPAVGGFPTTCVINFVNGDTTRGKLLSGFPASMQTILWPSQAGQVKIVNGAWAVTSNPGQWLTLGTITFNINHASGSDSSDGLGTSSGAFATIQKCIDTIYSQLLFVKNSGTPVCLEVAETFTENISCTGKLANALEIEIRGTTSTTLGTVDTFIWQPATASPVVTLADGCIVYINGFQLTSPTVNNSTAFYVRDFSSLDFSNVDFGARIGAASVNLRPDWGGTAIPVGNYWISGNVGYHLFSTGPGYYQALTTTVTLPNALTWGGAFMLGSQSSNFYWALTTFAGAGAGAASSGTQCIIQTNAVLIQGAVTFPGNASTCTASLFGIIQGAGSAIQATGTGPLSMLGATSNLTLSQNADTAFTVSNQNAGAAATATIYAQSNAGNAIFEAASTAGGAVGLFRWTGAGSFLLDALNATGNFNFRTGATPTSAMTIDSSANVNVAGPSIQLSTKLWESLTPPTISAGFCATSPSISAANGTAAFDINVGTACAGSVGTLSMPTATTGWACSFANVTNPASNVPSQTGGATNTVTLTNYARTTGLESNFTASDHIRAACSGY